MGLDSRHIDNQRLERDLDALFAAYREACVAPEPGPDFMPRLWQQIEARRSVSYVFGRWTQAFVTAAAALCLLLGLLQATLTSQSSFYTRTYLDVLQEDIATESPFYVDLLRDENDLEGYQ